MDGERSSSFSKKRIFKYICVVFIVLVVTNSILIGCRAIAQETGIPTESGILTTATNTLEFSQIKSDTPIFTKTPTPQNSFPDQLPVWGTYPPPSLDPITPIPPALMGLDIPDEVLVWVLLGVDEELPFTGRTNAIHVLLINPRLNKASLVSIPSNLYVYIPGYTMQRLNVAYSVGGISLLNETLAYNFGIEVDRFVLAHPGDFQWLIEDVGGLVVSVLYPMPNACNGIPSGPQNMNGTKALCYATYMAGMDEIDRLRRQQQLLRLIFLNLVNDGNLARLPVLYASYIEWIDTNFSLKELTGYIPLALKLADADRMKYFIIGWDAVSIWDVPGTAQAQVFLPNYEAVLEIMKNAIDVIMVPSPLSDFVSTLEYELTAVISQTYTGTPVATESVTPTGTMVTPTPTAQITPTTPLYP